MYVKNQVWFLTFGFILLGLFACDNEKKQKSNNLNSEASPFETLDAKIKAEPQNTDLLFQRATLFHENDAPGRAISDLAAAMEMDSTKPEYYHLLADIYLDNLKSFDAMTVMNSAVKRFPDRIPTLLKMSEFQLLLKKHGDSFQTIDQILKRDPQNAEAFFMMGLNLKEIGEDTMAINSFQSAVENDPNLIDAWVILGQMYAELGDPLALRYFDNALLIDSVNIEVLHARAFYLNEIEDLEGALATYRKIIGFAPNYEDAYFNSGLIYLESDDIEQAINQFDLLLEISPIYVKGYYYRGLCKEMKEDLPGAIEDFRQALKFSPGYQKAKEALERVESVN